MLAGGTRPRQTRTVRVEHDRLVGADGSAAALVHCELVDIRTVHPAQQVQLHGAFAHLCRTLRVAWQVVVQVRPYVHRPRLAPRLQPARDLDVAVDAHVRALVRQRSAQQRRLLFALSVPAGAWQDELLDEAATTILHTLHGAGLEVVRLTGASLLDETGLAAGLQPWHEQAREVGWGDLHVRGQSLERFPGLMVHPGWLAPLFETRCEADFALHVQPAEPAEAVAALNRRLRTLHADQLIDLEHGRLEDGTGSASTAAALELRGRLLHHQARPVRVSLTAVARSHSAAGARNGARQLAAGFSATMASSRPTHLRHGSAMRTVLPLGRDELAETRLVDSEAAATCVPWTSVAIDDPEGYRIGVAAHDGAPVSVDPFDTARHANANVAVLAASGHGKTYAVGALLLEGAARGIDAIVVDPENEYRTVVERIGGTYLRLGAVDGLSLNVFDLHDGFEPGQRRVETLGAVGGLVELLCSRTLDELTRAHVEAAAQHALRTVRGRTPLLADCIPPLRQTAPNVATVVERFCTGAGAPLFAGETSLPQRVSTIGLGLRDLRTELVPAATYLVAEWLWSRIRTERRRRHVVFDEVGMLTEHASLRTLLVHLARRCRKYDASLVVATQNAGDLLRHEDGVVIATNPSVVLLGGHRGAEAQRLATLYAVQPRQLQQIEASVRGEFLLLAGNRRLLTRIDMPRLHHEILTTRR